MIRRHQSDEFLLFSQHDHALLAGQLASHFGNKRFAPPEPREEVLEAISLHDCGWPLHDDAPTLNKENLPVDVFESPLPLALNVWREGVERCANKSPYTQILVSLHVLGLSAIAASHVHTRSEEFELNKFQHREIERQENLRRTLGLSTDIPVRLGLAIQTDIAAEEQLRRNHLILQAMDRLSLALLCTTVMFPTVENIVPKPGSAALTLKFSRTGPFSMKVDPWPFDREALHAQIPYKGVPARTYVTLEDFRAAYESAKWRVAEVKVHNG